MTLMEPHVSNATLAALQGVADQVGVGYDGLSEEGLRDKLRFEGSTT